MSQTLFLKSNILHIRTNEGEFGVSNPQLAMYGTMSDGAAIWKPDVTENCEWPGGVELNWRIAISTARDTKYTPCTEEYAKSNPGFHSYAVARLLPKEEKKAESAYKEFEEKKDQYGNPVFDTHEEEAEYRKKTLEMANRIIDGLSVNKANLEHIAQTGKINELIDKIFAKSPVSAPSESQEEWISLEIMTPNPFQWVLVWVEAKLMAFMACRRAYPSEQGSMWDSPFDEVELYNSEIDYWRPIPKFTRNP